MVGNDTQTETIQEARWRRLKELRWQGMTFADMVPILTRENYLPDHGSHAQPTSKGNRSGKRNAEICARCENVISQQWRTWSDRLKDDETELAEQRWRFFRDFEEIIGTCRRDYRQKVTIRTTKTKTLVATEGSVWPVRVKMENGEIEQRLYPGDAIEGLAEIVEVTEREEWRIYPQLLEIWRETRKDVARVTGLPVDEVGDPEAERDGAPEKRGLRVTVPKGFLERNGVKTDEVM